METLRGGNMGRSGQSLGQGSGEETMRAVGCLCGEAKTLVCAD
jgi:hypothetical protein